MMREKIDYLASSRGLGPGNRDFLGPVKWPKSLPLEALRTGPYKSYAVLWIWIHIFLGLLDPDSCLRVISRKKIFYVALGVLKVNDENYRIRIH
jgi:hypothetical protein